jgi:hypothetical protein
MMYQDKLVVAIKSNGKVLREAKDLVMLPFGSEFTVLVKNLNSRRAKFTLNIDGTDVLDGTEIIVNANAEVEMKRFIRNGNMDEGNAFKFIERTQAVEDGPRGIKVDDGVVRVQFWFEKEVPETKITYHKDIMYTNRYNYYPYYRCHPLGEYYAQGGTFSDTSGTYAATKTGTLRGMSGQLNNVVSQASYSSDTARSIGAESVSDMVASSAASVDNAVPMNDIGITVPGSKVDQKFTTVYGFNAETQSHVIILRIAGKIGEVEVVAPVTVKTQPKCSTCGKVNEATSKFCSACGTALTLL